MGLFTFSLLISVRFYWTQYESVELRANIWNYFHFSLVNKICNHFSLSLNLLEHLSCLIYLIPSDHSTQTPFQCTLNWLSMESKRQKLCTKMFWTKNKLAQRVPKVHKGHWILSLIYIWILNEWWWMNVIYFFFTFEWMLFYNLST